MVHAILLDWPEREARIAALAGAPVEGVTLLGGGPLAFRPDADVLRVCLPRPGPGRWCPFSG
jgi:hypothetical protein